MKETAIAFARSFVTSWAPRQLLKLVSAASVVIGVNDPETVTRTASFATAAVVFGLEILLSRLSAQKKA